jgi:hypothetical protein
MDMLAEAVAAYLCRHRSVGLFRLTLDLTRRRLELSAEVGAVEVVKGAVSPPAPGAWWRAAVREAVYALRHRGLVQYVGEVVSWTGLLKIGGFHLLQRLNPPHPPPVEAQPPTSVYFLNRLGSIGAVLFT